MKVLKLTVALALVQVALFGAVAVVISGCDSLTNPTSSASIECGGEQTVLVNEQATVEATIEFPNLKEGDVPRGSVETDFGDGTKTVTPVEFRGAESDTTARVVQQHAYATPGDKTVTVILKDEDGNEVSRCTTIVHVREKVEPAALECAGTQLVAAGQTASLTATVSGDLSEADRVLFDPGDGSDPQVFEIFGPSIDPATGTFTVNVEHTYATPGPRGPSFQVLDEQGKPLDFCIVNLDVLEKEEIEVSCAADQGDDCRMESDGRRRSTCNAEDTECTAICQPEDDRGSCSLQWRLTGVLAGNNLKFGCHQDGDELISAGDMTPMTEIDRSCSDDGCIQQCCVKDGLNKVCGEVKGLFLPGPGGPDEPQPLPPPSCEPTHASDEMDPNISPSIDLSGADLAKTPTVSIPWVKFDVFGSWPASGSFSWFGRVSLVDANNQLVAQCLEEEHAGVPFSGCPVGSGTIRRHPKGLVIVFDASAASAVRAVVDTGRLATPTSPFERDDLQMDFGSGCGDPP